MVPLPSWCPIGISKDPVPAFEARIRQSQTWDRKRLEPAGNESVKDFPVIRIRNRHVRIQDAVRPWQTRFPGRIPDLSSSSSRTEPAAGERFRQSGAFGTASDEGVSRQKERRPQASERDPADGTGLEGEP